MFGFLRFSDSVGWEYLPEMGQSLTWFMDVWISLG